MYIFTLHTRPISDPVAKEIYTVGQYLLIYPLNSNIPVIQQVLLFIIGFIGSVITLVFTIQSIILFLKTQRTFSIDTEQKNNLNILLYVDEQTDDIFLHWDYQGTRILAKGERVSENMVRLHSAEPMENIDTKNLKTRVPTDYEYYLALHFNQPDLRNPIYISEYLASKVNKIKRK